MADAAIMISWGTAIPGREDMGMGVFMESIQFWGGLKSNGDIEDFRIYNFASGGLSNASGMVSIEGTPEQINALAAREDYKTLIIKATHIVSDMSIALAETGDTVMKSVERLQSVRKSLGIKD